MGRHAKYTDEMITEMIRLRHAGLTAAEVGEKFGISSCAVLGILRYHRPRRCPGHLGVQTRPNGAEVE